MSSLSERQSVHSYEQTKRANDTDNQTMYTIDHRSSPERHLEVLSEFTTRANELDVGTILDDQLLLLELDVVLLVDAGESPLLGDDDLLPAGEFVSCAAESLNDDCRVVVLASDREQDLSNVHTGDSAIRLAPCTTHTGLQPIGASTAQHLVDTDDVVGVDANTQVERVLARGLGNILVGANTSGFEGF